MNLRKQTAIEDPINCPNCGETLMAYTDLANSEREKPKPGDLSICSTCCEPCEFGTDNNLVKLSEAKLAEVRANAGFQKASFMIKSMHAVEDPKKHKDYSDKLDLMAERVKAWKNDNPSLSPSIQYNFQKTSIIAILQDAIDQHFISVNEDAMTMFKELGWLDESPAMPTIIMVRVVLDHAFGKEE